MLRIPIERPAKLWSGPAPAHWKAHAGLVLGVSGRNLRALDLRTGDPRWTLSLPLAADEIHALSPSTILLRMQDEPYDWLAAVSTSGLLRGRERFDSHKTGASWIHPDGRGGFVEGLSSGYLTRTIQHRDAAGSVQHTMTGDLIGVRDGTIFLRADDASAPTARYEAWRDGALLWTLERSPDVAELAGGLLLFEESEWWNEWAEEAYAKDPGPPVPLAAYSLADGKLRWKSEVSTPFVRAISTEHLLVARGMTKNQLHRIALADGTVQPDVKLPGGPEPRPLACDDRHLLYSSPPNVFCVPAGAPQEVIWSLDAGAFDAIAFEDGVVVGGNGNEIRAFA